MRRRLLLLLLLSAGLNGAEMLPFGFAPPEIHLADVGTQALRSGDFNRDGLPDLVLINNERGRIDLYLQTPPGAPRPAPVLRGDRWQPVLEDARFQRQSLTLGGILFDVAVGDFNGDGADDLAFTDDQNRLHIHHGPVQPGWPTFVRLPVTAAQNSFRSLVWDAGDRALLLLGEQDIQEVRWSAETRSYEVQTVSGVPAASRPLHLMTADARGQGRGDLLYSLRTPRYNLAIHSRDAAGVGAPVLPLLDPPAERFVLFHEAPLRLLGLHPRSGALQEIRFEAPADPAALEALDVELLPLPGPPRDNQMVWADLDGGGREHLLSLSPGQPELLWFAPGGEKRHAPALRQPVPAGLNWMVPGRWLPGRPGAQLLVHNTDSKFLGLLQMGEGRLRFPRGIANAEEIPALAAWPSPEGDRLVGIVRQNRAYAVKVWRLRESAEGTALEELQELPLPFVTRDVLAPLLLSEAPAVFFVPSAFESGFFLFGGADGTLQAKAAAPGFTAGLLRRVRGEDFLILPEGLPLASRWVLLREGTAQFLSADAEGVAQVLDQLNLRGTGRLRGLLPLDADCRFLGLLDSTRNLMEVHEREAGGAWRHRRDILLPAAPLGEVRLVREEDVHVLRLAGRDALVQIRARPPAVQPAVTTLFESDLPGMRPQMILPGDFNGDGQRDIALIDSAQTQLMEFLHHDGERWRSVMHFQLFDTAQQVAGRRGGGNEPREALVLDVNGDGLDDFVLLLHDRLLVYIQDPVP